MVPFIYYYAAPSAEECDHIVGLAKPRMDRSGVVDTTTGTSKIDDIRTSTGTFLQRGEDAIIAGGCWLIHTLPALAALLASCKAGSGSAGSKLCWAWPAGRLAAALAPVHQEGIFETCPKRARGTQD
jgi:hypothetical protein